MQELCFGQLVPSGCVPDGRCATKQYARGAGQRDCSAENQKKVVLTSPEL